MKPHEETWRVEGCGNPKHGPGWGCWKVVNAAGEAVLRGVTEETGKRFAAFPAMARALLARGSVVGHGERAGEWHNHTCHGPTCTRACATDRAALREAGVLE